MPDLRVATILPVPFLEWEKNSDYHMALAHLMHVPAYGEFFLHMAQRGRFVLMDNGVVETGVPLPFDELLTIARAFEVTEMTLPDVINDSAATLRLHDKSAKSVRGRHPSFMAIPQGRDLRDWCKCAKACVKMADDWGVRSIGITKFLEGKVEQRSDAVRAVPEILDSGLNIHLLGTLGDDPTEIFRSSEALGRRVRGTDSGMAAIWTQEKKIVGVDPRPRVELDFITFDGIGEYYDTDLLRANIVRWKRAVRDGI